jgi:hypothetical protein
MAISLDVLQALASSFSAVRDGGQLIQPGSPVAFHVVNANPLLTVTDILSAEMNLAWITKDVRFNDFKTESALDESPFVPTDIDSLLAGGMPVRVPVVGNLVGTESLPGVPGTLNQLAGNIPIPVSVPVKVEVSWTVFDSDGTTPLASGPGTFSSPTGVNSSDLLLIFPVQIVELTASTSVSIALRFVQATVTLTAGGTSYPFNLPSLPVSVPAIGLPTVVVFFLHTNFAPSSGDDEGAALIVVPTDSPLRSLDQLQAILNTLQSTVSSLTGVPEFASFLLGLTLLSTALAAQPHIQFRVADQINNLNDITLISRPWYENDTEAEDELSSMIFIGPSEKRIECFNGRDTGSSEGQFNLSIGNKFHAFIKDFDGKGPVSGPDGTEIQIVTTPPGGLFSPDKFNDELSSIKFG